MMRSCIYRGHIQHYRPAPAHRFRYSTSWVYLDLDEVDQILGSRWCLSDKQYAPASFRRSDHFGDPSVSMTETVYGHIEEETGLRLSGPVRLLTQLRHFGLYFSPVNIFFCFDERESLIAMVAEVSNTPWNERHCYVLWQGNRLPGSDDRYRHPKEFHVSPFMGMDSIYDWHIKAPGDSLHVSLGCLRDGDHIFQADLRLKRTELTDGGLAGALVRRPIAAAHVIGAIYYQALRLWMKKCQYYPHPRRLERGQSTASQCQGGMVESARLDGGCQPRHCGKRSSRA